MSTRRSGRSGGPSRGPEGVGRLTRRSGRGREAHLVICEGSRRPSGGLGVVGRPSGRSRRPYHKSRMGWETIPKDRLGTVGPPGSPEGPPGGLGEVGSSTLRHVRGREDQPEVQEGSVGPPRGCGGVGSPCGGPEGPPGGLGGVGRLT